MLKMLLIVSVISVIFVPKIAESTELQECVNYCKAQFPEKYECVFLKGCHDSACEKNVRDRANAFYRGCVNRCENAQREGTLAKETERQRRAASHYKCQ